MLKKPSSLIAVIVFLALCFALACGGEGASDSSGSSAGVVKGVALSPRGFPKDYNQLQDFFQEISIWQNAGAMWNGEWKDKVEAGQIPASPAMVEQNAAKYNYTPLVVFGWRSGTTLHLS